MLPLPMMKRNSFGAQGSSSPGRDRSGNVGVGPKSMLSWNTGNIGRRKRCRRIVQAPWSNPYGNDSTLPGFDRSGRFAWPVPVRPGRH